MSVVNSIRPRDPDRDRQPGDQLISVVISEG